MALIITPPFRISFPALWEPSGYQDGPKKYGVTAIWNAADVGKGGKYNAVWVEVIKALDAKAREVFDTPLSRLPANIRRGIRNGNEKAHLNGYGEGTLFAALSADLDHKPRVVDLSKVIIPDGDSDRIYPGAWARASVHVYAYDNIGKGLALGLNNLQWLGHGDRLDSRTDPKDDFADDPDPDWFAAAADDAEDHAEDHAKDHAEDHDGFEDDIPF